MTPDEFFEAMSPDDRAKCQQDIFLFGVTYAKQKGEQFVRIPPHGASIRTIPIND